MSPVIPAPCQSGPCYAGIGSRETPPEILDLMQAVARALAEAGWVLNSGGADGADTAFEAGTPLAQRRIFLPWRGFNQCQGIVAADLPAYREAEAMAARLHPASGNPKVWDRIRKMMARNMFQILGADLKSPVRLVLCWAPKPVLENGRVIDVAGGTGQAVRLAAAHGIPVYHLGLPEHRVRVEAFLAKMAAAKLGNALPLQPSTPPMAQGRCRL